MNKLVLGLMAVVALGAAGRVNAQEAYCREYQEKVTIGGVLRQTYGTACMQPDGSWQKVSGPSDADVAGDDVAQDLQVAAVQPVQTVVYEQPVYAQPVYYGEPAYGYYRGPSVGLSLGFSDRDWHGGGYNSHGGGHDWHGGGHHR